MQEGTGTLRNDASDNNGNTVSRAALGGCLFPAGAEAGPTFVGLIGKCVRRRQVETVLAGSYLFCINAPEEKLHPIKAKFEQFLIICCYLFENCRFDLVAF